MRAKNVYYFFGLRRKKRLKALKSVWPDDGKKVAQLFAKVSAAVVSLLL